MKPFWVQGYLLISFPFLVQVYIGIKIENKESLAEGVILAVPNTPLPKVIANNCG